jgi:thiosulfate/3-mercaptopyruvate sulfurtransferase
MHVVSRRAATLGMMTAIGLASAFAATPVAAAMPLVQPAWLADHLGNPQVVVLDIRPEAAYQAGHVPGAISADYRTAGWTVPGPGAAAAALPPVDRIAATIGALGIGDGDTVVIVAGEVPAAARVYWTFKVLGHTEVAICGGPGFLDSRIS